MKIPISLEEWTKNKDAAQQTRIIAPGTEESFFWECTEPLRLYGFFVTLHDQKAAYELAARGLRVGQTSLFASTGFVVMVLFQSIHFVPGVEMPRGALLMLDISNYSASAHTLDIAPHYAREVQQ